MSFGLLILRLSLGAVFFAHGAQKVLGWWGGRGMDGFIAGVTQMGFPGWMGYLAAYTEFLGGIAIIIGLLTRVASLGIVSTMVVAIWKVHGVHGFFLNGLCLPDKGQGYEYALTLLCMALCLVFTGAGKISIDGFIRGGSNQV